MLNFFSEKSRYLLKKEFSGCKIVKVCGGYHVFESYADYKTWKGQK